MNGGQIQIPEMRPLPLSLSSYAAMARVGNDKDLRDAQAPRLFSVQVPDSPYSTLVLVSPVGKVYRTVPSLGRTYRAWRDQQECSTTVARLLEKKLQVCGLSLADLGSDLLGITFLHGPRERTTWATLSRVKYFCLNDHLPALAGALIESMSLVQEWQAEENDIERNEKLYAATYSVLFGPLTLFGMIGYGISADETWRDVWSKLPQTDFNENKQQFEDGLKAIRLGLKRAITELGAGERSTAEKWRRAATLGTPNISWPGFVRGCSYDLVSEVIELRCRVIELLQVPQMFAALAEREFMDLEEKPNQLDQLRWIAKDAPGEHQKLVQSCVSRLEIVAERIRIRYPMLDRNVLAGGDIDASIKKFVSA